MWSPIFPPWNRTGLTALWPTAWGRFLTQMTHRLMWIKLTTFNNPNWVWAQFCGVKTCQSKSFKSKNMDCLKNVMLWTLLLDTIKEKNMALFCHLHVFKDSTKDLVAVLPKFNQLIWSLKTQPKNTQNPAKRSHLAVTTRAFLGIPTSVLTAVRPNPTPWNEKKSEAMGLKTAWHLFMVGLPKRKCKNLQKLRVK